MRETGSNSLEKKQKQVAILAEVEHNRWNVEELLLGYRPVTKKEQEEIEQKAALKNKKRDEEYAHYDIRPYNDLRNGSEKYDIALTRHLLLIVKQDGKL